MSSVREYDEVPQGWARVRAALGDRLSHDEANGVADAWEVSRFSDSESLRFIVEEDVISPNDVEVWQARTGHDKPVAS